MKRLLLIVAAVLLLAPARPVEAAQKKTEESPLEKLMDSYKNVDGSVDFSIKRFWLKMMAEADSTIAVTDTTIVGSTNPASSENKSSCVSDEDMERLLSEIETVLEGHYRRTAAVNGYGIISEPYGSTFSFDEASSGMYYLFVDKSLTPASIVEIIVVKLLKEQDKVEAVEVCQVYVDVDGWEMIDEDLLEKILDISTEVI